jgi:HNH endonuclease
MMRQLKYRDRECVFPGCGARRFTQAHHIVWRNKGGPTDLDNLILVCFFHHNLVHEYGWSVKRRADGEVRWFRPDGTRYGAGPAPPGQTSDHNLPSRLLASEKEPSVGSTSP